jgi:predicted DNA-binding transcriptional regulator AlpA
MKRLRHAPRETAMSAQRFMTRREVAGLLTVHPGSTYRTVLPAPYRIGPKTLRWDRAEIEVWLQKRKHSLVHTAAGPPRWPRLISRKEVAACLGVHPNTTRFMRLPTPYHIAPKTIRWDANEIDEWIAQGKLRKRQYVPRRRRGRE